MQRYDKINQLHVFKYSVSRRRPRGILQGTLAAGSVCLLRSSSGFAVTVIMQQEQRIVSPTRASTWQSREYCTLLQQPKKNQESQLEPTRGRLKPSRAAQLGALTAGVKPVSRVWDAGGEHGDGCASREQEWSNM